MPLAAESESRTECLAKVRIRVPRLSLSGFNSKETLGSKFPYPIMYWIAIGINL